MVTTKNGSIIAVLQLPLKKVQNDLSYSTGAQIQRGYMHSSLQVLMAFPRSIRTLEIRSSINPQGLGRLADNLYLPLKG